MSCYTLLSYLQHIFFPCFFSSCWISLLSGIGPHTLLTMDVQPASTWGSAHTPLWPCWKSKSHIQLCLHHWVLFVKTTVCAHLPCVFFLHCLTSSLFTHVIDFFCLCAGFLEREYSAVCTMRVPDCGVLFAEFKIFLYLCVCMLMLVVFIVHNGESTFVFACL